MLRQGAFSTWNWSMYFVGANASLTASAATSLQAAGLLQGLEVRAGSFMRAQVCGGGDGGGQQVRAKGGGGGWEAGAAGAQVQRWEGSAPPATSSACRLGIIACLCLDPQPATHMFELLTLALPPLPSAHAAPELRRGDGHHPQRRPHHGHLVLLVSLLEAAG
jgi:hypothetical protein